MIQIYIRRLIFTLSQTFTLVLNDTSVSATERISLEVSTMNIYIMF